MAETMRALCKSRPEPGAELIETDIPQPGPNDILVKIRAASICGTDLHIYNWDPWAQSRIKTPLVFGHECSGEVIETGRNVRDVQVGDYVSLETHITTESSYQTKICQANVDPGVKILGIDRPGSYAEYVAVPAKVAWKNPPDMAPEIASIQEPFGNAVYTVLSAPVTAKTVLVTGCGPIGLWAVGIAKAAGAKAVYATDINPLRLELAERMGATLAINSSTTDPVEVIMSETGGIGVDVLCEMSGNWRAIKQGFAALRNGGRVSILGIPPRPIELDLANDVVFKGATIYGISGRLIWETWYQTQALITSGMVDPTPVITHRFKLEQFDEAFKLMNEGKAAKVALFP
ncbi:MAG TPA: L-threonine 3-dehydrogenase [Chloroflexia bacterium]|nr:L-threonine 3-dehydrogenase [Chloroflexia bacterium]